MLSAVRETARFLSPIDEDEEISENTGGFEHAELMRAAYDELLEIGLPIHVVRQGGDDDPDAIAEPESADLRSARENPSLEPTEVVSLVEKFRENNPLLDRLTGAGTVDIEAEHSTGDTAPGVTLEHIARSTEDGRRCLMLARPDTAESIARRLDEHPECMRTFSGEDGAHRLYNADGDVRAGPDELKVYRRGGGQNKWLFYEETGEVELRVNGETIATFDGSEDVFADPAAYPATEGDISDFSGWTTIKRPELPSRLDRSIVDVIAVTDDGLKLLEPSGNRTPIGELRDDGSTDDQDGGEAADGDQKRDDDDQISLR